MSVWNIRALINASNWNQTTKNLSVICGIGVSYRYTISNKISETKGSKLYLMKRWPLMAFGIIEKKDCLEHDHGMFLMLF